MRLDFYEFAIETVEFGQGGNLFFAVCLYRDLLEIDPDSDRFRFDGFGRNGVQSLAAEHERNAVDVFAGHNFGFQISVQCHCVGGQKQFAFQIVGFDRFGQFDLCAEEFQFAFLDFAIQIIVFGNAR